MAGQSLKLTVLGGGSFFTPSFIGTMCRTPQVWSDAEVRLVDPDAERVSLVAAFCRKFTSVKKVPMTFRGPMELDAALEGADFVITTFRIGGLASMLLDETIPPRFGYIGDETAGPGGIFMAMRTAPAVLDVARRMERLCPRAWLLNYANPTNFIADAFFRSGFRRGVGLCDGFICPPNDIGVTLGVDPKTIATRHAGINHCSWTYRAQCGGRDLLEELRRIDDKTVEKNLAGLNPNSAVAVRRWLEVFRMAGVYPAPAGHMAPYFFQEETLQRQQQAAEPPVAWRERTAVKNWDRLKAVLHEFNEEEANKVARTHFGGHADLAIGVAVALATDSGAVWPVNVPHGGAVQGISPETILEVYSVVSRDGFAPIAVPPLPKFAVAQQAHLAAVQQLAVDGILQKDRGLVFQALCLHPFTKSIERAKVLFDAMWKEEKEKGALGPYWA
jgi:6-phospho-beta-glucosidase